jgi:hypothetical protein
MSQRTWAEYLEEATRHLRESRTAVATGVAIPASPDRPTLPIPDDLRPQALLLAAGYDQLAAEVCVRMSEIQRHRLTPVHTARPAGRFVDRHA